MFHSFLFFDKVQVFVYFFVSFGFHFVVRKIHNSAGSLSFFIDNHKILSSGQD